MIALQILTLLFTITLSSSWKVLTMENDVGYNFQDISSSVACDQFFHGTPWPMPVNSSNLGVVKLCQNQVGIQDQTIVFATLFSSTDRIPLYTAYTVSLTPGGKEYKRPSSEYWHRVSVGLCNLKDLPVSPILSMIGHKPRRPLHECGKYQAIWTDYEDNGMHLDRGHLCPNFINSQDRTKQLGTFTLTNAAPQYAEFNEHSWWKYECITHFAVINLVPNEKVFLMTGTYGNAVDEYGNPVWLNINGEHGKNPVRVPGYYWKAVCYPGNAAVGKPAWAYAVVQKNENKLKKASFKSFISLKEFANQYFHDLPFGDSCINAPFGEFGQYLSKDAFDNIMKHYCGGN